MCIRDRAYFDVLGAHGPGFKAPPNISPDEAAADPLWGGHRSFTFRRVEDLRQIMVDHGDAGKQIWLLEFGWTTDKVNPQYSWYAVTLEQQADYIVRAYKFARDKWSPWIGPMFVWNIADPAWTQDVEQYWWSITNPDGTTRPAFDALSTARSSGALP